MPLSKDKAAIMFGEVNELFEDAVTYFRNKRLDRAAENAALYRGWHTLVRDGSYPVSSVDPEGEEDQGINISRMLVRAAVATTLKQMPSIEVPAAKDDQKSRAKADYTEKLAVSLLRTKLDHDELHRAVSWSKQTGAAWMKVCWDQNAGRVLPQNYDGFTDKEVDRWVDNGFGGKALPSIFEGDISSEFIPTTDGFPDPSAKTRREMQHFFHVKLLPLHKLRDRFPVDYFGEDTYGRFGVGNVSLEQRAYMHLGDDMDALSGGNKYTADANTLAELVEFWELPSRRFPQGRFIAFSGTTLIAMSPNPYFPARLPFVLIQGDNLVPGSMYSDGILEDARGLNKSANRVMGKLREHLDKVLNAHLIVPFQAGIDKNIWGEKPGQIIQYQKGYKPEALVPPDIPPGMFEFLDVQIDRAKMITGYTDVGRGEAQNDLSGRAVAFYTENEQSMREPDMASHRRALLEVAQHMVLLARQFYDDGRMISLVGENGKIELTEFATDDFDWENDFVPEVYTGKPSSHAALVSEVIEFAGAGLFEDTPAAERARRMLGDNYAYVSGFDPFREDRQRARRENLTTIRDPMAALQVQSYDTHQIHLEEHYKFMRTIEFEELPQWQKQSMFQHTELHEFMAQGAGMADPEFMGGGAQIGTMMPGQMMQPPGQPGAPQGQGPPTGQPPGPPPNQAGAESPPSGGAPINPAPPPSIEEFTQMDPSEQNATDQI